MTAGRREGPGGRVLAGSGREGALGRLVAAIDMTPLGRRVAERCRLLAESGGGPLLLLHVVEPLAEWFIPDGVARLLHRHRHDETLALREWCAERSAVTVQARIVKGSPPWEIVRESRGAELVAVGPSTAGLGMGPVARRVVEMAWSDVLVVKRQPRVPYRRVVVAVDFSSHSVAALERAFEVAGEGDVTVVYALPSRLESMLEAAGLFPEEVDSSRSSRLRGAEEAMAKLTARWEGKVRSVVVDGSPVEAVEELVRRRSADLAVVGARGAGATRMTLLGSVAEGLAAAVPCDVLVTRSGSSFRRP